jgi:hypothetical protein
MGFLLLSVDLLLWDRVVDRVLSVCEGRGESEGAWVTCAGWCGEAKCSNRLASRLVRDLKGE